MAQPDKVKQVMAALDKNAEEAECECTVGAELEKGVWRLVCGWEQCNSILAYVEEEDQWYYQLMYGDVQDPITMINGRPSKKMPNNHFEALACARVWYTG